MFKRGGAVVAFPGNDPQRDLMMHDFLVNPVDSRAPLTVPDEPEREYCLPTRSKEVKPEVQADWEMRLMRIRQSDNAMRATATSSLSSVPSIARRAKLDDPKNPYHCVPVEEVAEGRDTRMRGPAYLSMARPPLRGVPQQMIRPVIGRSRLRHEFI